MSVGRLCSMVSILPLWMMTSIVLQCSLLMFKLFPCRLSARQVELITND